MAALGLLAAGCPENSSKNAPDSSAQPVHQEASDKDCCIGKNDCKGQGGCGVADAHSCAGKNECKGQGGCNMHCPK